MMQRSSSRWSAVTLAAVVVGVTAGGLQAGKYNRIVNVGDPAPTWSDPLVGTDGKTYRLDSFADASAVVVLFTCNDCPVVLSYQPRIEQLARDYKAKRVVVIAINVNQGQDLEAMKAHAADPGMDYLYLRDSSQQTARDLGATCTPHAFLFDEQRKIVYMGAIDDNWQDPDGVEVHYLRDAIEDLLAGKPIRTAESRQVGCGIKWNP